MTFRGSIINGIVCFCLSVINSCLAPFKAGADRGTDRRTGNAECVPGIFEGKLTQSRSQLQITAAKSQTT